MKLPNVTLRQLEYLVAVADSGSLTTAAARCHVTQATISSAITEVERALGLQLLMRSPRRGSSLTAAGRQIVEEARTVLHAMSHLGDAVHELGQEVRGTLVVGCYAPIAPFVLPAAIATFTERYPEVTIEFIEGTLPDIQYHLLNGRCEIAFAYDQALVPAVASALLYDRRPRVLVHHHHPLAGRESIDLAEVADDPFILLDVAPSEHYFRAVFEAAGLPMRPVHRAGSFELARSLVARGLGYSLTVQQPALQHSYEGLAIHELALRDEVPTTPVMLCWAKEGVLTRRAEAFLAHCHPLFAEGPPALL